MNVALVDIAADAVARAKRMGATSADAMAIERRAIDAGVRQGAVEKLEQSEAREVGLRVFVGQSSAMIAGSVLDSAGLDKLAEMAIAMARAAPPDPHAGLAEPEQLYRDSPDLDLVSSTELSANELKAMAVAVEGAALAVKGITKSNGAGASFSRRTSALVGSNGLTRVSGRTSSSLSVSVIAGDGLAMERDYDSSSALHPEDLRSPDDVGQTAADRALKRLNPRKVKSQAVPVIFDRRASASLVGHFIGAILGSAIARGTSFLKDMLGKPVFNESITITDDPLRRRGLGSRAVDGEGLATQTFHLADKGVLTTWLLDLHAARQLNLISTGHASRGLTSPPSPSSSNVHLHAGQATPDELIRAAKTGLLVTDLIGFGVNQVTGDYSRGASGFWIENGELAYPVSEITIAGNLKDMFRNMTAASDLEFRHATNAPSLLIEGMTVAGA